MLSICQLHILLSRTAQISLELHFCVELHTKKPWYPMNMQLCGSEDNEHYKCPNQTSANFSSFQFSGQKSR